MYTEVDVFQYYEKECKQKWVTNQKGYSLTITLNQ